MIECCFHAVFFAAAAAIGVLRVEALWGSLGQTPYVHGSFTNGLSGKERSSVNGRTTTGYACFAGVTFWFTEKRFLASYLALICARRA